MVEKDIMLRRLSNLEEYLKDLEQVQMELDIETLNNDKVTKRYIERTLHMAVESCLDITGHIISYKRYREPLDNKDKIKILLEEEIIDTELGDRLVKMAQFRNIIVHDYTKIDPEILYSIVMNNIKDLKEFSLKIKEIYFD